MMRNGNYNGIHRLFGLLAAGAVVAAAGAAEWHVPGDFATIQAALDAAADGDEIIVHPGTYPEAIDFLGKAMYLHSSDGAAATIIDATGLDTSVVTCASGEGPDTVLGGFTVTGGTGTPDEYGTRRGGGMYNENSSPTVTNCALSGNWAEYSGGGMYNKDGSPTVTGCLFSTNSAMFGGGLYSWGGGPLITDCTFSGNSANGYQSPGFGGGMFVGSGSPTIANCTFSGNSAHGQSSMGGGMCNWAISPTVINCTFIGNSAFWGGGLLNSGGSATVINCSFNGNIGDAGGGMTNGSYSNPTVTNCTFSGNSGCGMFNSGSSNPTVTNCTFNGNSSLRGGGMFNNANSTPTLTNCAFSGNSATDCGGAVYHEGGTSPTVTNCVLWGDTPDEFCGDAATVTYSDVEGGYAGTGNIDADPLFVDPANGNFRLQPGSPCIDAGDNTAVPAWLLTDLDGNPRFWDDPDTPDTGNPDGIHPIVDMGSYEFGSEGCPDDDGDGFVEICHIPPGHPERARTIRVPVQAAPAHLAHGDYCGPCDGDEESPPAPMKTPMTGGAKRAR
jgi:parallel beta-helix repeat protein